LSGKESQICIRQPDRTIIEERKVPTRKAYRGGRDVAGEPGRRRRRTRRQDHDIAKSAGMHSAAAALDPER
jgi:hypothetical protein